MFCSDLRAQNISELEYFFDNDPAVSVPATTNTGELTQSIAIPLTGLASGFHKLTFRAKDDANVWSLYHRKTFYISEPISANPIVNLSAAEYWFDTDPGHGNGSVLAIPGAPSETIESFAIPLGTLDAGFHTLSIRVKNLDDTWSLYHRKTFYIISPDTYDSVSPLTDAEFLYDAELGFGTGTAVAITPTGNPDEYLVEIPTNLVTCDFHDISLSVKNALGNYSLYDITTDTDVYDNVPPTIVVFPNITVELNANGQAAPFTIADVDNGTFDDCQLASVVLSQTEFNYTCANLGANTVTVTATDAEAKVSTLDVTVTVVDNVNPVAITQNITVQLDANGNATTTADAIDNNSTDNCNITSKSLDVSSFTCANLGANTVALTVTDQSGNQNTTNAIVTVEDNVNPVAITQNITAQLDANGNATTTADAIDNNSIDNCSIASKSLNVSSFTCANLGANTIALTVIDQSGNQNTTNAIVTVEDNINPVAMGQDITIDLAGNPSISIVASDVDNGSNDNCGAVTLGIDVNTFIAIGDFPVELTVTDSSGNTHDIIVTVTVGNSLSVEGFNSDSFKIFPNPTKNSIHIDFNEFGEYALSIYGVSGKKIFQNQKLEQKNIIDFSKFSSGIYFLKIKELDSNKVRNIKIIKQ